VKEVLKMERIEHVKVEFDLYEDEIDALNELLPFFWNYKNEDGFHPFSNWDFADLFKLLLFTGSSHMIWDKIKFEQYRQCFISYEEYKDDIKCSVANRGKFD
jgi:hypothetical protein